MQTNTTSSGSRTLATLAGIFPSRTYHAAHLASLLWSLREALAEVDETKRAVLVRAYETRITDACYSPEEDLLPECGAVLEALHDLRHEVRP